jgi:hypothetical protein
MALISISSASTSCGSLIYVLAWHSAAGADHVNLLSGLAARCNVRNGEGRRIRADEKGVSVLPEHIENKNFAVFPKNRSAPQFPSCSGRGAKIFLCRSAFFSPEIAMTVYTGTPGCL